MDTKVLIVVDMQNDFITGSLGTREAEAIVPNVVEKIKSWKGEMFFTQDTHKVNYMNTQEGKWLPIEHCIVLTDGWKLHKDISSICGPVPTFMKNTFSCSALLGTLCTDVCVVSNALMLKSHYPEIPIIVDANCCAGTTQEMHKKALDVMRSCQIIIKE